jgi:hypothetical protein
MNIAVLILLAIMHATLSYSIDGWDSVGTWGWDYPLCRFVMMRLGWESSAVVDMMMRNETKNIYSANGHTFEALGLPCYLRGNGGLLSAVAMTAGGYLVGQGRAKAVGFPKSWGARSGDFKSYP